MTYIKCIWLLNIFCSLWQLEAATLWEYWLKHFLFNVLISNVKTILFLSPLWTPFIEILHQDRKHKTNSSFLIFMILESVIILHFRSVKVSYLLHFKRKEFHNPVQSRVETYLWAKRSFLVSSGEVCQSFQETFHHVCKTSPWIWSVNLGSIRKEAYQGTWKSTASCCY